jgi:hypothetical protein
VIGHFLKSLRSTSDVKKPELKKSAARHSSTSDHNGRLTAPAIPHAINQAYACPPHRKSRLETLSETPSTRLLCILPSVCNIQPSSQSTPSSYSPNSPTIHTSFNGTYQLIASLGLPCPSESAKSRLAGPQCRESPEPQGRLSKGRHHEAKKTEFCGTKDGEGEIIDGEGCDGLYSRRGP